MKIVMIKKGLEESKLIELGYTYSVGEAGYISQDEATIIIINRCPYKRQVQQYSEGAEIEHEKNINQLKSLDMLEL
jgi:hypothetical protein